MDKYFAKVRYIKVGKISKEMLIRENHSKEQSAIKKHPVMSAQLSKLGFIGDEQGDTQHHGGENKAVLFFSSITYNKLNILKNTNFEFNDMSYFGENLLVSHAYEENVCIGDVLQINDTIIEITQPRQPCWKLSFNTNINSLTKSMYEYGFTGWYGKVLQEGTINQDDIVLLKKRVFPDLTINLLNQLIINPKTNPGLVEKALSCKSLGKAFKLSLEKRYTDDSFEHLSYQK
ncbi:MAG: MOSC domain-containing protein [Sulfurimonas sp.]|jgi:MOSC domain-containing protein YiiM|nr:MOSC domain-containing protein [Sulfurimonas sp.]